MSGKNREKSGNFEVYDKWQPCQRLDFGWFGFYSSFRQYFSLYQTIFKGDGGRKEK